MIRTRRSIVLPALAATASLALGALVAPAGAADRRDQRDQREQRDQRDHTVLERSAMPLQIAVGSDGTVYVAQSGAGVLTAVDKKGRVETLATVTGSQASVPGVDAQGKGTVTYTATTSTGREGNTQWITGGVHRVRPNGRTEQLADILDFERRTNPDARNWYMQSRATDPACLALFQGDAYAMSQLHPRGGIVDSHPYSVLIAQDGSRIVADAGANALFKVSADGHVSTLTVFPALPTTNTEATLRQYGFWPQYSCLDGTTFNSEPVPTDVEQGPDGQLYVTTLSGGIAPGGLWRVDPTTGAATQLLGDLPRGIVNLAVADDGTVYLSHLSGNRILQVRGSVVSTLRQVPSPGGLEWADGRLYVGSDVFRSGRVFSFVP